MRPPREACRQSAGASARRRSGPPQACSIRRPRSSGEEAAQVAAVCSPRRGGRQLFATTDPRAAGDPASAPPERDPAVARRAEVVHEPAPVGDRLAAGPADLLEHIRHRLGEDDVARGHRQPGRAAAEAPPPVPGRDDRGAGADAAAAVSTRTGGSVTQRRRSRRLVDRHAGVQQAITQAAAEACRLHRGGRRRECSRAQQRRCAAVSHPVSGQTATASSESECAAGLDRIVLGAVLRRRRRGNDLSPLGEPRVDVVIDAPAADRADGGDRGRSSPVRASSPAVCRKRGAA